MDINYRLQQYEDGTFGYYLIDGNKNCNYNTESKVVCMQEVNEGREDFISKNGITFKQNQYDSNLNLDKQVNDENYIIRKIVTRQGYNLEKLIDDKSYTVHDGVNEFLNEKADDSFIIDLGNKLLDKGYKLSTNNTRFIFTDETCTKFKFFISDDSNEIIY